MELELQIKESLSSAGTVLQQALSEKPIVDVGSLPLSDAVAGVNKDVADVPFKKILYQKVISCDPEFTNEVYPVQEEIGENSVEIVDGTTPTAALDLEVVGSTQENSGTIEKKKLKKTKKFKNIFHWPMFKRKPNKLQTDGVGVEQIGDYLKVGEYKDHKGNANQFNDKEHTVLDEINQIGYENDGQEDDVEDMMNDGDGFRFVDEDDVVSVEVLNPPRDTKFNYEAEVNEFNQKLHNDGISKQYRIDHDYRAVYVDEPVYIKASSEKYGEDDGFMVEQVDYSVSVPEETEPDYSQTSEPMYSAVAYSEVESSRFAAIVTLETGESEYESIYLPSQRGISRAEYQKTPLFNSDPIDCMSFALQSSCARVEEQNQHQDRESEFYNAVLKLTCGPNKDVCGPVGIVGIGIGEDSFVRASSPSLVEVYDYDQSCASAQSLKLQSYVETPSSSSNLQE